MPDTQEIVINTSPIIALVAAWGDLSILQMYHRVLVPREVCDEVSTEGSGQFAAGEFAVASWLDKQADYLEITAYLSNSLDRGEAAVIELALLRGVQTVCIDETAGRRIARLHNLKVTGSIGILLRAKQAGYAFSMQDAITRMQARGIWLSKHVIQFAMAKAGESPD